MTTADDNIEHHDFVKVVIVQAQFVAGGLLCGGVTDKLSALWSQEEPSVTELPSGVAAKRAD